jgi:signal transduction histidine kinase
MPVPFIFLDVIPARGRALYIDSLMRVGIGVTDRNSTTTTVVSEDDGHILVRAAATDDVRLSSDIGPDDLAQVVKCVVALSDMRARSRPSELVERQALEGSAVVHDANNALMAILFAARELRDAGPATRALAQQVLDGANHIATMFQSFLSSTVAAAAPLDVNLTISELMRLLEPAAARKAPVTMQLSADIPRVAISSNDLARVVTNLVANARDFVVDASPVTITTSTMHLSEPDSRGLPAGHWVLIEVADSGTGMDPFTLAHATEPFFTTKRTSAGTGLGLSSARHLVRQAGGHLRIDSAEGVGTRVRVFLPEQ